MDKPEIKFGDKLFLYGNYMALIDDFDGCEYNSVIGYKAVDDFSAYPINAVAAPALLHGVIVDHFGEVRSLGGAWQTPFFQLELVDVTRSLSRNTPLPAGTKVWMPTKQQPVEYLA